MPNIKTLTDTNRLDLVLDKYDVFEVLPGHFDETYPNLAKFLIKYYETLDGDNNPAKLVNELLTNRDVVSVQQEFLVFLSNELLLGKPYFEQFNDKRTALQFSNLLYRSKGTKYSIQQFFRIFYSIDVDIEYGRDFVFNVGDPLQERLRYETQGSSTGSTFRYTFQGSPTVLIKDSDEWYPMRQDIDYVQNFVERRIEFLQRDLINDIPVDGKGYVNDTPLFTNLADTGFIGFDADSAEERLEIITDRESHSTIGVSSGRRLTNDQFYQLFAIMIKTPVGVDIWRDAYKTFVHPAGMYLAARVQVISTASLNLTGKTMFTSVSNTSASVAKVFKGGLGAKTSTDVTELAYGPYGYMQRSRINDMLRSEYKWNPNSDLIQIGSYQDSVEGWGSEYLTLHRADNINSRTIDDTYITLSNTINTLDENVYTGQDSDGLGNPWLPGNIDIRPPVQRTFYLSSEGGLFLLTENGELIQLD